jgi:hypothetical protein
VRTGLIRQKAAPLISEDVKKHNSSALRSGCFCVTLRSRPEEPGTLLLNYMDTTFKIDADLCKLSSWYFSVHWARLALEQRIEHCRELSLPTNYDEYQAQQLLDLEQFLKMSWDQWMDRIEASQAALEVK